MILIFGGAFDPPHYGHLRPALKFVSEPLVKELRFVPYGLSAHKPPPIASSFHRLSMLRCAFKGSPIQVDEQETTTNSPIYTIDTLHRIRARLSPLTPLALVVGEDACASIAGWKDWQVLPKLAHIIVLPRHSQHRNQTTERKRNISSLARLWKVQATLLTLTLQPAGLSWTAPFEPNNISSTRIRRMLQAGTRPQKMLPPCVLQYIEKHQLYG